METNNHEEQYLTWLCSITNKEELIKEINAIIDKENNSTTLQKIVDRLVEEISIIDSLIKDANQEEIKLLEEDKKNVTTRINIVKQELQAYENKKKREEQLELFGTANILFAINSYGNIMLENDLKTLKKNCQQDVYDSFLIMIQDLINGKENFNKEKQKPVQPDSNKLKGIYSKKDFQARLLYRYAGNYLLIIGATIKKSDLDKKYRQFCINCKEKSDEITKKIENNLTDINELSVLSTEFYKTIIENEGELKNEQTNRRI